LKIAAKDIVPFNDLSRIHKPLLQDFIKATSNILDSSNFVLGEAVSEFEKKYASLEEVEHCVSVDNGTNAIELMLRAVGIKAGDEVITTAFTFIATVFAIERIGAIPVLVDVEQNSPLMSPLKIEEKISGKTKAILVVSLHGRVANVHQYAAIATRHKLLLLLDGAQSHLSNFDGVKTSKHFLAISTSFYPGKNLGSLGEGGAVLTNDETVAKKVRLYRDWGAEKKYEHSVWGGNFRLHALQAKFLSIKLDGIEKWTEQRRNIGNFYNENISTALQREKLKKIDDHVYHIYEIRVTNRLRAIEKLDKLGISWGIHYPKNIPSTPAYQHLRVDQYPNSEKFAAETISLPLFPEMTLIEQERVISAVLEIEKLS
jgi:dTDP-4-amino-4,6-dideoxygalactose transaminase